MNPSPIKFGTDGWRGIIADTFTFDNVRLVTQAVADWLLAQPHPPRGILIGYDHRFQSPSFARVAAEVLLANHIPVCLAPEPLPTPAISFAVRHHNLNGGIMITASHNPPEWNGFKFKTPDGASADPEITTQFEARIATTTPSSTPLPSAPKSLILDLPILQPYLEWLRSFVHFPTLRSRPYRLLMDSMFGVGKTYVQDLLRDTPHTIKTIRTEHNPSFCGIAPEPVPQNLNDTIQAALAFHADLTCITDGDADRLAALDSRTNYLITPRLAVLIAAHLLKNRGLSGAMIKTVSCSVVVDRFARKFHLPLHEKPVGFKYIVPYLRSGEALVGTEESGGLGIRGHIPERDGILASLILLEALIGLGFSNSADAADWLDREFGALRYHRLDAHYSPEQKHTFLTRLKTSPPKELLGQPVVNINTTDGVKFICADDSWLLLRFSGTEPLVRFYAEAYSPENARALTEIGLNLLNS
ncbi:MAG: phosphoglucomutase/phosphomannomutase family protein [bacterium]|nr:phosphoglucomutase/phosphomannomutase family protein [bacterium]